MTKLVEQIARALAEAEHGECAWEHLDEGWHRRYRALAQAVLPFIAAERERCAVVAYATCAETRHVTLGDKVAAAIRSQQP